ncbi:MAG: hypothetical protein EAX96_17145 [Candidatus Lokiarchaeota archaeon]|nr:hypothetical protein [Candidatus Lokiarchaeota archaeon]
MQNKKLNIDIYVPINECGCMYDKFMERIFNILMDYMKYINFETKDINSEEAKELGLRGNCVVVEGNKIFTNSFELKNQLPKILKEKKIL